LEFSVRLTLSLRTALVLALLGTGCSEGTASPTTPDDGDITDDDSPIDGTDDTPDDDVPDDDDTPDDKPPTKVDAGKRDAGRDAGGVIDSGKPVTDAGPQVTKDGGKVDPPPPAKDGGAPVDPNPEPPAGPYTLDGFENLAPPMGEPLDPKAGTAVTPAAPAGWVWYEIADSQCRDGSPAGFYVHFTESSNLLFYLEGGGACTSPGFCAYNPKNVNQALAGDGQTLIGSVGGAIGIRQQPGKEGVFNFSNASNPFKDWSQVYVPYCTGDVHFGTRKDVQIPGLDGKQQFVGYFNMQKFVGRIVPTFKDKVKRVVLTGASAGGFGTSLNYSMVQDAFETAQVIAVNDSGPPFPDSIEPVCMQKRWRELWGFADSFAKDCDDCKQADGGGLINISKYYEKKHPHFSLAMISSMQDEVIRSFYAPGLNNCSGFETGDPAPAVLISFPGDQYEAGLIALRKQYEPTGKFASYYINGAFNKTYHQHIWRPRFYEAAQGGVTINKFVSDFLAGKMTQVGP
jgi:hypothetical protein